MQNFKKIVDLIKKTGDKCIVYNPIEDNSYVVMGIEDYESMILGKREVRNLTEDQLLDKINRDIAVWKSSQNEGKNIDFGLDFNKEDDETAELADDNDFYFEQDDKFEENDEKKENLEDDKYYFEPLE